MKNKHQKPILLCCISLIMFLVFCSPFIVSHFYLPSEIKLVVGEEHLVEFGIPIKARVKTEEQLRLKDADKLLDNVTQVSLNEPLYIQMNELGKTNIDVSILGGIPLKTVSVEALPYREVIPCGEIIGVKVKSDGICVLGTSEFEANGKMINPSAHILQKGDMILSANSQSVESKEDFKELIQESKGQAIQLQILRQGEKIQAEIVPVYSEKDDEYKIGTWIKDGTQGIGTLTYVDPETLDFGALGHGITDSDLKKLIPIKQGEITKASITSIKKGEKGDPGEISGIIEYSEPSIIGNVSNNTSLGIFGKINDNGVDYLCHKKIPVAFQNEVHEGKATILASITGEGVDEYEVYVQKVAQYSTEPTKGMIVKITDEKLLDLTHGIVQGMSGSPIIQDGKLIGAITHVFVQDPTKGYGIFIENMLNTDVK